MGRRTGTTEIAAGLATGIGLWFTRAALDVVPGRPGGLRVAMLGSWADLVGLTCLVLLSAFLARTAMPRLGRSAPPGGMPRPGAVPAHLLAPLSLALLLGIPYLPWLPDAFPVLRVLAGPARFGVWIVALGLSAWRAAEVWIQGRGRTAVSGLREGWPLAAVFVASLAIVGTAAGRLAGHGSIPGGDEPHYLVITQSLLADGDLQIENNHARRDYAPYFQGDLHPDYVARGRNGAIYSIHPVGLPVLVAPAFALAGYRGVVWLLVVIAACGATLLWQVARRVSGSATSATTAWMAVAGSAPFVLHGFAVYPEVPAALCALYALCGAAPARDADGGPWLPRGICVALLPWLGTKYAPMAVVIVGALALRGWERRSFRAIAAAVLPFMVSVAGWLAFFWAVWGVPTPTAPYGNTTQTSLANLLVGGPALLVDQEYGLFAYAPALMLSLPGLWCLWRDRGNARRLALEIALAVLALGATVGAYQMWWGGSAAPGRQLGAALLLAGVAIARWDAHVALAPLRRAIVRMLVLAGLSVSGAVVFVQNGLLAANARDGTSRLLDWLAPGRELVRAVPSAIALHDRPALLYANVAIWLALVVAASWVARRWRPHTPGAAGAAAGVLVTAVVVAASTIVPLGGAADAVAPAARAEAPMLRDFDARRRPVAVVYDPWRAIDGEAVPPLFAFDGAPGLRRAPQPLRVLYNTRLSLPAGSYALTLQPAAGAAIRGRVGLQVGRMGPAMIEWTIDEPPGHAWTTMFSLGVDSNFVGVRYGAGVRGARVPARSRPRADRKRVGPPRPAAGALGDAVWGRGRIFPRVRRLSRAHRLLGTRAIEPADDIRPERARW